MESKSIILDRESIMPVLKYNRVAEVQRRAKVYNFIISFRTYPFLVSVLAVVGVEQHYSSVVATRYQ
jgi:hypothetical protein